MGDRFTRCMIHGYSGLPALDFRSEGLNTSEFAPILPVTSVLEDRGGSVFERLNVKSEDAFSLNVLLICSVSRRFTSIFRRSSAEREDSGG